MKKNLSWLFLSIACLFLILYLNLQNEPQVPQKQTPVKILETQEKEPERKSSGNERIDNFNQSKRILKKLYADHPFTFYCGCPYNDQGIDFAACGFKPHRDFKRAKRIEWEHIVPAADFGRAFVAWREGDARCVDHEGKRYRGRKCANLVSPEFNRMEADLYNLVPAIGEVNGMRKDYPMGLLPGLPNTFGQCKTKISDGVIEPREEVRGFIARTYKYMNDAYRGRGIISRKNEKLFDAWDKQYAPDKHELERARRIEKIQGNKNVFVEGSSKLAERKDTQSELGKH